jgi:hypothetical protein
MSGRRRAVCIKWWNGQDIEKDTACSSQTLTKISNNQNVYRYVCIINALCIFERLLYTIIFDQVPIFSLHVKIILHVSRHMDIITNEIYKNDIGDKIKSTYFTNPKKLRAIQKHLWILWHKYYRIFVLKKLRPYFTIKLCFKDREPWDKLSVCHYER